MQTNTEIWHPKVGDWFITLSSYCTDNPRCTDQAPCDDCLALCNKYVVSSESYNGLFFYGAGLCNRDGGCSLNQTYSYMFSTAGERMIGNEPVSSTSKLRHIPNPEVEKLHKRIDELLAENTALRHVLASKVIRLAGFAASISSAEKDAAGHVVIPVQWANILEEMANTVEKAVTPLLASPGSSCE